MKPVEDRSDPAQHEALLALRVERDTWAQELFEANRYVGSLLVVKHNLIRQVNELAGARDALASRDAEIAALIEEREIFRDQLAEARALIIERTGLAERYAHENAVLKVDFQRATERLGRLKAQ